MHWDGSSWSSLDLGGLKRGRHRRRDRGGRGRAAVDRLGTQTSTRRRHPGPPCTRAGSRATTGRPGRPSTRTDAAALGGGVFTIDPAARRGRLGGLRRRARPVRRVLLDRRRRAVGHLGGIGGRRAGRRDLGRRVRPSDEAVTVARFDGRSWVSYGPSDGLPGPNESAYVVARALPTKDGVYVGTGAGIYRLDGDRWERAWPRTPPR